MNTRKKIDKMLDKLSDNQLKKVLEFIHFIFVRDLG